MRILRLVYTIYSVGFVLFSFRAISGVLVSGDTRDTIVVNKHGKLARLLHGVLRAVLWPVLIFRAAGIR